jgi:2-polyprenyl-3-methyl-5-hydroxy-6-metoxy-1,4-benzoquinol methylase
MPFFEQSRFPRLWLLMQNAIGGRDCKQALALEHYQGEKRVLEIGCSVGNISSAFCAFPEIEFVGIDIDRNAINLAKRRFRSYPNFDFSVTALDEFARQGRKFDYVLFAAMLHHVSDEVALRLLQDAVKCTAPGGRLIICEPEALKPSDSKFMHFFYSKFEQGKFLRVRSDLIDLVERAGITVKTAQDRMISPGIVRRPHSARFNLVVCAP